MGSSSEQGMEGGVVSAAPGTLVWVRRRNGSWWPGLVMSPEGLPPRRRKGMPVKLLGKENGSMDWYDVQKSKRIKAFRCGEYEECIEKATKSLFSSNISDRLGKYARRDDAIMHALEIEKSSYSGTYQELCSSSQLAVGCTNGHKNPHEQFTEPQLASSKAAAGNSNPMTATKPMTLKKRRWKRLSAPDDNENKVIRRMRGLHDIGTGMRSKSVSDTLGDIRHEKTTSDNVSTIEMELQNGLSCGHHETNSKNPGSPLKTGTLATRVNWSSRRKKRRRPLSKVLASTEMVMPQFYCERETQNDLLVLDSSESKKTDISVVINNSSDCSDNSCEKTLDTNIDGCHPSIDDEDHYLHEIHDDPSTGSRFYPGCADNVFDIPVSTEGEYSVDAPAASTSCLSNGIQLGAASEKQHVYGDGSVQILQKKEINTAYVSNERKNKKSNSGSHLKTGSLLELGAGMGESAIDAATGSEFYLPSELYENGFPASFKGNSHRLSYGKSSKVSGRSSQIVRLGMVSSDSFGNAPLEQRSGGRDSWDVDPSLRSWKRVTSSYSHADVANHVSASSRKRRKQSSLEKFVSGPDLCCKTPIKGSKDLNMRIRSCSTSKLYNVNIDVQASHKGPHVPLVSLMSKLNGKAIVGHPIAVDYLDSGSADAFFAGYDRPILGRPGTTVSKQKKKISWTKQANTCPVAWKVNVEFSKAKKARLISKKMRKLSTISVGNEKIVEKAVGTSVVSCVPLKLVFSRINEDLGRRL